MINFKVAIKIIVRILQKSTEDIEYVVSQTHPRIWTFIHDIKKADFACQTSLITGFRFFFLSRTKGINNMEKTNMYCCFLMLILMSPIEKIQTRVWIL